MTRAWTPGNTDPALSAIANTPRLVVALDFDGTASHLVDDPMSARAVPEVRASIDRLLTLPDTVVAYVSGRSLDDLRVIAEHDEQSEVVLAGSHGAQYWYPGEGAVEPAQPAEEDGSREELWAAARPIIDRYAGVLLEEKTYGMGVHGRMATPEDETAAFAEIDALVAQRFPHWRRRVGNHILEFSSRVEGKDSAMQVLRERFAATGILFAGDDVTDEDALASLGPADLGVRVGPGETAATLRVENPQQIAALLGAVATERAAVRE